MAGGFSCNDWTLKDIDEDGLKCKTKTEFSVMKKLLVLRCMCLADVWAGSYAAMAWKGRKVAGGKD